jgi:hypothetical protein
MAASSNKAVSVEHQTHRLVKLKYQEGIVCGMSCKATSVKLALSVLCQLADTLLGQLSANEGALILSGALTAQATISMVTLLIAAMTSCVSASSPVKLNT